MKRHHFLQMHIFLFVVVLSCILPIPNLSYAIPDGDLTGDGAVTISDALRALRISVGLIQPPNSQDLAQGDVAPQLGGLPDSDGSINISDALSILRKVVGLVNWPSDLSALLSGDQETPPVITGASAVGTVSVDPVTKIISGGIVTSGITGILAHIHDGDTGVAGPIIIPLVGGPSVWNIPANTVLTDAQLARLLAGGLYYNVHSAANPDGEIRGQITQQVRFASLSGANEVPPIASTASATAVLAMNPLTNQVSGFIKTTGIVGILAHIHPGAAGVNGPVAVPLLETPPGSGLWTIPAGSVLTAAQAALFNIGSLYYNVHSNLFPGGEIRGQIVPSTLTVKTALLDGAHEVPPVTTAASGTGVAVLNGVTLEVRGDVVTTGVVGTATQIEQAVTGANGPTIVPMAETVAGSGLWFIPGTTPPLTPAQAAAFNAGGLNYNALSLANPTGEIRGQINGIPLNSSFLTGGGIATAAPLVSLPVSQFDGTYTGSWSKTCPTCGITASTGTFTTTLANGVFTGTQFTLTSGDSGIRFDTGTVSSSGAITGTGATPIQCSSSVSTFTGQITTTLSGGAGMTVTYSRTVSPEGCAAESGTITATRTT